MFELDDHSALKAVVPGVFYIPLRYVTAHSIYFHGLVKACYPRLYDLVLEHGDGRQSQGFIAVKLPENYWPESDINATYLRIAISQAETYQHKIAEPYSFNQLLEDEAQVRGDSSSYSASEGDDSELDLTRPSIF